MMVKKLISQIDTRTKHQYKNIFFSAIFRGISLGSSLVLVPLSLKFISTEDYGIWLTISSLLGWFGFLDIGLGNGLKNKLSESIANNDETRARGMVSTSYVTLSLLATCFILIFVIGSYFIDWYSFLNISNKQLRINSLINICSIFFSIKLVLDLLNSILLAYQKTAFVTLLNTITNLLILGVFFFVTQFPIEENNKLLVVGLIMTIIPLIIMVISSTVLFHTNFKRIKPSVKYFKREYVSQIGSLGLQFLILQISVLVLFSTDNILISKLLNPEYVTIFNVAYKIFSSVIIIWSIIIAPYWTAFTEAYTLKDILWIKKTIKTLLIIWIFFNAFLLFLTIYIDKIIFLWLGRNLEIDFSLSLLMALYVSLTTLGTLVASFLNGISKIRIQVYLSVAAAIINIPLSIFFVKHSGLGLSGIMLANCISISFGTIICSIQVHKILNNSAHGLWSE